MLRGWAIFSVVLNLVTVGLLALMYERGSLTVGGGAGGLAYADFVTILLTALAVLITVLAVILAVAGVWGFQQIRDQAVAAAERVADETADAAASRSVEAFLAARSVTGAPADTAVGSRGEPRGS